MPKPPKAPPPSDISGIHRDKVDRRSATTVDAKARAQMDAETRESAGRPDGKSQSRGKPDGN